MALLLLAIPLAGIASDRVGRRLVLAWAAGGLAVLAYPLMGLMAQGSRATILAGQAGLALLIAANGTVLPATMAELAPWRVRCTVLSIGYNATLALLGGSTPMVAAWLVARTGVDLAPSLYLSAAATITFVAALRLPRLARHRMTEEFRAAPALNSRSPVRQGIE